MKIFLYEKNETAGTFKQTISRTDDFYFAFDSLETAKIKLFPISKLSMFFTIYCLEF